MNEAFAATAARIFTESELAALTRMSLDKAGMALDAGDYVKAAAYMDDALIHANALIARTNNAK